MISPQRPLAHLDLETVLVSAFLDTWKPADNDDTKLLLKRVKILDYPTGKTQLAPTLDHCWLWIKNNYWQHVNQLSILDGHSFTLLDEVYLCCTVGPYRRSDGSTDWGIRPRNEAPITAAQSRDARQRHRKLESKAAKLTAEKAALLFAAQSIYATQLELNAADWREIDYSHKAALSCVRRIQHQLRRILSAHAQRIGRDLEATVLQLCLEGSRAISQTKERIAESEV